MRTLIALLPITAIAACSQDPPGCGHPDVIQQVLEIVDADPDMAAQLRDVRVVEGDTELGNYSCAATIRLQLEGDLYVSEYKTLAKGTIEGPVRYKIYANVSEPSQPIVEVDDPDLEDFKEVN